ncbi:MAG: hypothetical protein JO046_24920 [Solirubrobacterales bacterium]|nr:hypothetical protein [Solirubrobacterales bacterium]
MVDVAPSDSSLTDRVAELEQQLFDARETIRDPEEEFEASRAVNQSLMRAQNAEPLADRSEKELATNDERKLIIEAEFAQVLKSSRARETRSPRSSATPGTAGHSRQ